MSGPGKSKKVPPPNRLLAYKPIVSPKAKPAPTRSNTKGKAPSGRNVGKLADLLKMPLDVFYEIVSYLHPLDILHLARASLKVRSLLMSRKSVHAWVTARRTIDMPECPPDLSEPQYASLVFEHTCFACGTGRAMRHNSRLKVRFCGNCWKENIKTNHELNAALVPNKWNKGFGLELLPSADDDYCIVGRSLRCSFYKPEYDAVLERYVELKKGNRRPALSAYIKECKAFVRQSFEFGRNVDTWWTQYSAKVSAEKDKARENKDEDQRKRKNAIHTKLIEAGYSFFDFPIWDPEWNKTVMKRGKLTDKRWNSNMFPKLKGMIEAERARKEEVRRKDRYRERTLEFIRIYLSRGVQANESEKEPFMMPSWEVFEDHPRVKALLAEDDYKIPFTEDRYEQIEDLIAQGAMKYNIRARQDFARMHDLSFPPWDSEEEADEKIVKPFLAKATTVFHIDCATAPKCLPFKTVAELLHLVVTCWDPAIGDPPKLSTILLKVMPDLLAGRITRELLRVAGAPEDSTWEEMDRICGTKLVCTCRRPDFRQPAHITTLIQHIQHERTWSKLSEADERRDEGSDDESGFPIDHAVSEIPKFVKLLPEGEKFDAFMLRQPPPLGGSVGNLSEVRNPVSTMLGYAPRLEERRFVCDHCGDHMTKDYLVWHMNTKHKKVAHPNDVATWTFPPGILDTVVDGSDDSDDHDSDPGASTELFVKSLLC